MPGEDRIVVIGSGPSGAMAAHQLVKRGARVTLLESGSEMQKGMLFRAMGRNFFRRFPEMQHGNRHVATGDPKTDWYTNLSPGGLSNQWTGAVPRFCPEDFTEGGRLHDKYIWPVTYDEMAPWYEAVERLMDVTAARRSYPNLPQGYSDWGIELPADWRSVAKVAERHGQGLSPIPLADGPPWMLVRRATAFNSFTNIVAKLMNRPNFELRLGAHALKIDVDDGDRAKRVIYRNRANGQEESIEAGGVIVACGPLFSTKLLFQSACKTHPEGLGNADGNLGKYLHDHPKEWWVFDTDKPISYLAPSGYLTRLPHASSDPLMANSWTIGVQNSMDRVKSRFGLKGSAVSVQVFGTMVPEDQYFVRPTTERIDEFGTPGLEINIRYNEEVVQNMVDARSHFLCVMEEAGYKSTLRPVEPQLFPGVAVHYGGTCRMHAKREFGVLDPWNRLWDLPNIAVVDAASFTTGAEKNPTPTLMALAARAADRMVDDLKSR